MRTGGRLRRRAALIASVWALTCGSVRPASADVTEYLGRTVTEVRFELEGADVRDAALASLLQVRVGQPLDLAAVRETLGHLFTLGRYEDIQVRASLEGGGVAVVFDLVPLHRVQALEFRGPLVLDPPLLRAAITDRLGPTPAVGRAGDAAAILEDLHRDHGYRHATVSARSRIDHRPDRTTLIFDLMPGAPTRVGTVTVEGERVAPTAVLEALNLGRNDVFRQVDLDQALARYRGELQERGYYEARANYLPRFSADELTVDLTIVVDTGPLVRLRFEGDPLPEDERAALVPIARERSADEDLLEDAKRRIENRLQALGYRDALAEYRRDQFGDVLTIVFTLTRGPLHRLERLEIVGSSMAPELQALVRLREGEPFVESILAVDVAGMLEFYLRRGFAGVAIDTMVSSTEGVDARSRLVTATISVTEGERTFIGRVTVEGNSGIDETTLRSVAGLAAGQPFYEPETNLAADALVTEYADRGYQNATVQRTIAYSEDRGTVDVAFRISEGVQVIVDQILIAGNTRTSSEIVARELTFRSGDPLGQSAIVESQRRLGALGLFRRIQITPVRHPGEEGRQDVLVTIEEAPATTIGGGGGPEGGRRLRRSADGSGVAEERIEFGARGFFEIGRRNLWGKNRSINLFGRVSLRPRGESVAEPGAPEGSDRERFNEYRVLLTYREPRIFGTVADGQLSGVLEQGIRSSFNFTRRVTSFEVGRRLTPGSSVSGRYSLEQTQLFDERPDLEDRLTIDRLFPEVRLSAVSSTFIRDTRFDPLEPVQGTFATVDTTLAARAIGSEVGFVKTLLKGFLYRQLPRSDRLVLAGGATLGLAHGFPRGVNTDAGLQIVEDLPASERFFAGGDTTVRGFALDRLGTEETIDDGGFPTGGQALVVLNAELRARVWRDIGAVGFLDVGNVFALVSDVDPSRLRGSVGLGIRYRSPIGPIRVDLGFKLSRFDFPTGQVLDDGTPETRLEPLTALHVSLGQAF